jgi:hypothetical protein
MHPIKHRFISDSVAHNIIKLHRLIAVKKLQEKLFIQTLKSRSKLLHLNTKNISIEDINVHALLISDLT